MHPSSSSFFLPAAIVAVSTVCISTAAAEQQEQEPLTCKQFEALFPEAIKYDTHRYYTVKIDDSAVVCFYNKEQQIAIALVMTRAVKTASKLEKVLHMVYNPNHTAKESHKRIALLINTSALPKYKTSSSSSDRRLPTTTTDLIAALIQLGNTNDFTCKFLNWSNKGLVFYFASRRYGESDLFFSPNENNIERIYIDPHQDTDSSYYLVQRITTDILNIRALTIPYDNKANEYEKSYKVQKMYRVDDFGGLYIAKVKRGLYVIGKPSESGNFKPSIARPERLPKKTSAWPADTDAPQEESTTTVDEQKEKRGTNSAPTASKKQQPPPTRPTQPASTQNQAPPANQRSIHTPAYPAEALRKYLEHLQHL